MPSERIQRQIDALLDQAEEAVGRADWAAVLERVGAVLAIDAENADAAALKTMADGALAASGQPDPATSQSEAEAAPASSQPAAAGAGTPTSFAGGRYVVERFLGEGGKKRVYLAHDELLDRDVAFALIRVEGLDDVGRERIAREAQAMGRLGTHPHVVTVFDRGEHDGQPYIVSELMGGGDVEGLLEDADGPLTTERALEIAKGVCQGLAFAHEKGIVHRDIKPGNVLLTEDGVAKIGDLGLAVSMDRSRLTQHGIMVGTVAYMPPEQALGGETTPQADLYPLGAMLYELVTGSPPFPGDDPTAVISQHINTRPVAPSWNTENCPPDLEELILRLLEKVPGDRPESAASVLEVLDRVDPAQGSATRDSQSNPLDRLRRGVFVGRERELDRLREAADEAFAGRGSVVMLVGEPGIGKTCTAQELETYARMRGATVAWGRSHEAAGAPAYWPWTQIGRSLAPQVGVDALVEALGGVRSELVRLLPEIRDFRGFEEPPEIQDPQAAQFQLFDAFVSYLRASASLSPVVVVVDDLHWADKPTLLLLQHLARELASMRALVVGTYRDTELSRTHPLSETLAELNRGDGFARMSLRGLSAEEVADYVRAAANIEPSPALVERVYEETEGNPFFLSEVVNLMTEEGTLDSDSVSDIAIPEGVREALGRRLDRLSEEANELLTIAAVVGREFTYDTLTLLGDRDNETLLGLIESGLDARVIEEGEGAGRYRFTHALMQETLLAELSTTRRVRLHGQIGEALEARYGDQAEERAARLAQHFGESATLTEGHAEKAARYSQLAGAQAEATAAWAEGVRHYANVVAAATAAGGWLGLDEAEVRAALSRCQFNELEHEEGRANALRALEIFRQREDATSFADTVIALPLMQQDAPALLSEALSRIDERDTRRRAQLLALAAQAGAGPAADQAAAEARVLAEAGGFKDVMAGLLLHDAHRAMHEHRFDEAYTLFRRARETAASVGGLQSLEVAAVFFGTGLDMSMGRIDAAVAGTHEIARLGREWRAPIAQVTAVIYLASAAFYRADWARFEEIVDEGRSGFSSVQAMRALLLDDLERASSLAAEIDAEREPLVFRRILDGLVAKVRAHTSPDVPAEPASWQPHQRLTESQRYLFPMISQFANADEYLVEAPDDELARWAYGELESLSDLKLGLQIAPGGGLDQLRGNLALRLDLIDEAEEWFRTGLEWPIASAARSSKAATSRVSLRSPSGAASSSRRWSTSTRRVSCSAATARSSTSTRCWRRSRY